MLRTHTCGELNKTHIGKEVALCGWVSTIRDHGGVLFIDLRDRYGITQVLFNPTINAQLHVAAQQLHIEFVARIKGKVTQRPQGTENKSISTGEIEIIADELKILNSAEPPLFEISDDGILSEDLRYRYRYLDLRRPRMQKNLLMRHKVIKFMRDYMDRHNFIEVETPILTKSTPEGARDYLVPSRVNAGKFYALPQSPQLFKQLLMVGGIDRYFQIAKCFRDEDLRADRQPEFTQLDIEMSFLTEEDIFSLIEGLLSHLFKELLNIEIKMPLERLTHAEAMRRFGCDKPDMRFAMELVDMTKEFQASDFKVFQDAAKTGIIKGLNLKSAKNTSRSRTDSLTEFVKAQGGKGLVYFKIEQGKLSGPVVKFLSEELQSAVLKKMDAKDGDLLLFVADAPKKANSVLDELRRKLAAEEGMVDKNTFKFLWVTEFPMFAYNEEEKRWESEHHPFTAPHEDDVAKLGSDMQKIRARSYDLVLNGVEMGSGSIRIHQQDMQKKIFSIIGIGDEEAEKRFGFLTQAFRFGAPVHGGVALGIDRLLAVILGYDSIREIIAFPKTQRAVCMLTDAPSDVSGKQLDELGIKIKMKKEEEA